MIGPAKKVNKGGSGGATKERLLPFIELHTSLKEKGLYRVSLFLFYTHTLIAHTFSLILVHISSSLSYMYVHTLSQKLILILFVFSYTAMLSWFVDSKIVEAVLKKPKGVLIEEDQVEVQPENLPHAILDENVDVHLIRKYVLAMMPGWWFRVL